MPEMDKSRVCEIGRVNPEGSEHAEFEGEDWESRLSIGSGYFIAPHLVITAKHVLLPGEGTVGESRIADAIEKGIYLCWYDQGLNAPRTPWRRELRATAIPYHSPTLDIAILECRPVAGIPAAYVVPERDPPRLNASWVALGFARAADREDDERRGRWDMWGASSTATGNRFELKPEKSPPEGEEWKGASGSAVFDGQGRLFGVIVSYFREDYPGFLEATPVSELWKDPKFIEFWQKQNDPDWLAHRRKADQRYRKEVARELGCCPGLLAELGGRLTAPVAQVPDKLTDALLGQGDAQLLKLVEWDDRDIERKRELKLLFDWLLPAVQTESALAPLREARQAQGVVQARTGLRRVVEVQMAALDGRRSSHRLRNQRTDDPGGFFELPHAPEVGFVEGAIPADDLHCPQPIKDGLNETAKEIVNALTHHLQGKLGLLKGHLHCYLYNRFGGQMDWLAKVEERHQKDIGDELQNRADQLHETYYLIIGDRETGLSDAEWNELVAEFKKIYPAICFLRLDPERRKQDEALYFKLRELIPIATPRKP